jgi:ammonium transporter, Amt family
MPVMVYPKANVSMSQKVSRLAVRLRDPEWRRYGRLLLAGKFLGIGVVLLGVTVISGLFFGKVFAADVEVKAADIVNPINTVWTLIAAFLVFGMQVGFTMLEAGFCRSRETVNVLMECIVDTYLCGLLFYAFGFAFMFARGNGFIGYHWFFLKDAPATYEGTGVAFLAFWLFQFAFADTWSTITSGAMMRADGICWRSVVQCLRIHLPDHRSLGVGTGWLSGDDGERRPLLGVARCGLP